MALARRPPNVFAGSRLDRAVHLRRDSDWLAGRLADPATRLVLHWRGRGLGRWEEGVARAVHLAVSEVPDLAVELGEVALLGLAEGIVHLGWDLSRREEAEVAARLAERGELADLRAVGAVLPA